MLVRSYYGRNTFSLLKYLFASPKFMFITGEMTSDMMKASNDIRHTLFGAFNPTQNVTHKLRTQLEKVTSVS